MPSVGAQSPPPSASANTAPAPPSQFGGPYQWVYPTPKAEKPKYIFNGNPLVLTKDSNFLDWKVLMADYLVHVSQEMWDLVKSERGYQPVDPKNLTPQEVYVRHLNVTAVGFLRKGMEESLRSPFLHITNAM